MQDDGSEHVVYNLLDYQRKYLHIKTTQTHSEKLLCWESTDELALLCSSGDRFVSKMGERDADMHVRIQNEPAFVVGETIDTEKDPYGIASLLRGL